MAFILERLAEEFRGRLGIRLCHFPLDPACNPSVSRPVHPLACELAAVAECAADQGRLRDVHDEMLMYQPSIALWLEGRIPGAGTAVALRACADTPAIQERVRRQVELGLRLNIAGTPTVFFNGVLLRGGLVPPSVLCHLVRQALGRLTG
jgi:protein-disulfide isomerase